MSAVYLEYIYLGLDLLIGCSGRSSPSDKGGGGERTCQSSRPRDKGGAVSQKFFWPFGPHFGQSIRGEPGPPGPLPWICHWAVVSSL